MLEERLAGTHIGFAEEMRWDLVTSAMVLDCLRQAKKKKQRRLAKEIPL